MAGTKNSTLIVIGGHEDRKGKKVILQEVARRSGRGRLVVTTVASEEPDGLFEEYRKAFRDLGVEDVRELAVDVRADAKQADAVKVLDGARAVFFTGGDQLKISSQIGATPVSRRIREIYAGGGVVAGTSAGASVVCETMLVSGG